MTICKTCGGSVGWSCDCDPRHVQEMAGHEAAMEYVNPEDVLPFDTIHSESYGDPLILDERLDR